MFSILQGLQNQQILAVPKVNLQNVFDFFAIPQISKSLTGTGLPFDLQLLVFECYALIFEIIILILIHKCAAFAKFGKSPKTPNMSSK